MHDICNSENFRILHDTYLDRIFFKIKALTFDFIKSNPTDIVFTSECLVVLQFISSGLKFLCPKNGD